MKYKIHTYIDFLNLKPSNINKIIDDDFDLYSDEEMKQLAEFIAKFNLEIYNITHKNIDIAMESTTIDIENYTNGELIIYFKEHPNK